MKKIIWEGKSTKNLKDLIASQTPRMRTVYKTVDWGQPKRQGKRSGGVVTGGMSAAPKGKKVYHMEIPDYPEWEGEILRTTANPYLYSMAREAGLDHKEAGKYAILGDRYFN